MRTGEHRFFSAQASASIKLLNTSPDYPNEVFYGMDWQRVFGKPAVIKDYGWASWDDTSAIKLIYTHFELDNPLETGVRNETGWLSPKGVYYPCPTFNHEGLSLDLTLRLFHHTGGSDALLGAGWIRVSRYYILGDKPTFAQESTLVDLLEQATGSLRNTLIETLRREW